MTTGSAAYKQRALALAQPLTVHLELTYRCNWRCVFCYNPRHHDRKRMSLEEWITVLEDLRALGTLTLTLTGGEPLTHPEFFEIAREARRRAFALRIFTNGALVDDAAADQIAALLPMGVEMSLHGATAETHDRATATAGSFRAMFEGLDRLKRRGVPLQLKTPLTRENEGEIEAMVALVASHAIPYAIDPALSPRDDGDRAPLAHAASRDAVRRLMQRPELTSTLIPLRRDEGSANCGLGRITMAIDPEGNVYPCIQWRHSSLGNVRRTPLRELWMRSSVREEAAGVATAAGGALASLGGAAAAFAYCPAIAYQETGDPLVPDEGFLERATIAEEIRAERAGKKDAA